MTCLLASRVLPAVVFCLLATSAVAVEAQTCRGTPSRGGVAFVHGDVYGGSTNGVAAALAGKRFAISGDFHSLSENQDVSAFDASLRLSLLFGATKLRICPGLGFRYKNEDWSISDGSSLKARIAAAELGLGFGYETEVYKGISVIPFLGVDYQFSATVFNLDTPDASEDELSGDTLSHFNIQYGFIAQYKFIYAGMSADRYSDTKGIRPYLGRWTVGLTFGGSNKSSRQAPVPRPSTVRSSARR